MWYRLRFEYLRIHSCQSYSGGRGELTHPSDTLPARSNHGSPERSPALNAVGNEHHLVRWPARRINPSAPGCFGPGFTSLKPQGFHGTGITPCSVKPNRCLPICRLAGLVTSRICRRVGGSEGKSTHDWAAVVKGMCTRYVGGRPQEPTPSQAKANEMFQ